MKFKKNKKAVPPQKKPFKGFSLTFRLSLGITLLITLLMAAVGFATFMQDRDAFMKEIYSRGWSTVGVVQTLATIPLKHNNYRLLNELTSKLARDPFINEAAILDSSGKFVAHNNQEKLSKPETGQSIAKNLSGKDKHTGFLTGDQGTTTAITFSGPVKDETEQILGYVYIAADISRIQAHLQETVRNILFNFVLASIAGMLLTRLIILRSVHRPVQSLVRITERVSTGDFSEKVDVPTRDELGRLGQAFNTMNYHLKILFDSIRSTVSDMGQTSSLIVQRSQQAQNQGHEDNGLRQKEMLIEINSAARRLTRMSDKLNSLVLQFKTETRGTNN